MILWCMYDMQFQAVQALSQLGANQCRSHRMMQDLTCNAANALVDTVVKMGCPAWQMQLNMNISKLWQQSVGGQGFSL